jgi:hypothetical protein
MAIAFSGTRLINDEARRISKLISRLPELSNWRRTATRREADASRSRSVSYR